ncbi:MAG: hypothetical protein KKF56_04305, partial [Nanoarchaeota archaeon]|nr:hypothetical protein [Nanoarchaeota archaeon]
AVGTIFNSLLWGALMAGVGYMLGEMLGPENSNAGKAAAIAMGVGGTISGLIANTMNGGGVNIMNLVGGTASTTATNAFWVGSIVGIAVAAVIFVMLYEEWNYRAVVFECKPWVAPSGSAAKDNCELCNNDPMRPCSEYRCRSLGQSCALVNANSSEFAMCYWQNPGEVGAPVITPNYEVLSLDHSYNEVSSTGMRVKYDMENDGCVKAFTPLTFGVVTDKPAQCKVDYNHTSGFDNMRFDFGSNIFLYNHTMTMSLPSPSSINAESPVITNDGVYTLYVRCKDGMDNANTDEFSIRFCVGDGPDTTPPEILLTNPLNGKPVQYNLNETDIWVYLNEPADCKWSRQDRGYDDMNDDNQMICDKSVTKMNNLMMYKCTDVLTGLENSKNNDYYFRCRDQPNAAENDRNTNTQSYKLTLIGTRPFDIIEVGPNGTVEGYANVAEVELFVETANGYNQGDGWCYFSTTGAESDYILMGDTNSNVHRQTQSLVEAEYTYYFKCHDLGGNADYANVSFRVDIDREMPIIARAFKDGDRLVIMTDEKSECSYSEKDCDFALNDGVSMPYVNSTEHYVDWTDDTTYHIKCKDQSGNQPVTRYCSMIIKGWEIQKG